LTCHCCEYSELRTPLNGLIGTTELLFSTPLDQEQMDYCRTMEVCSRSLLHVINDILDFSKIQAGRLDLDHSPFSLDALVYDVFVMTSVKVREPLRATLAAGELW
jgi:signal transduction histidine kinase